MATHRKKLGEILIEMKVIDDLQLKTALGRQQSFGMRIGKALVDGGFCAPEDIVQALARQTGHQTIDLDAQALDSRLVFTMNVKAAEKHRAVPLRLEGKRGEVLVVAAAGPADLETHDALLSVSGKQRVVIYLADDEAIERAIGKLFYGRQPTQPKPAARTSSRTAVPIPQERTEPPPVLIPSNPSPAPAAPPVLTPASAPVPSGPPVLLYGWREGTAEALLGLLQQAGVAARVVGEDEILQCTERDIVFSTCLALEALLPPRERLPGLVILAGMPADEDLAQARAFGVGVYLRAPLNADQLLQAVRKGQADRGAHPSA